MKLRIQFTNIPELLEIFPLDKWSRNHATRILGIHQIGYAFTPTTMSEYALRFATREDFDLAKRLLQEHEITD